MTLDQLITARKAALQSLVDVHASENWQTHQAITRAHQDLLDALKGEPVAQQEAAAQQAYETADRALREYALQHRPNHPAIGFRRTPSYSVEENLVTFIQHIARYPDEEFIRSLIKSITLNKATAKLATETTPLPISVTITESVVIKHEDL